MWGVVRSLGWDVWGCGIPPFRDETTERWGIHSLCGVWGGLAKPVEVISSIVGRAPII